MNDELRLIATFLPDEDAIWLCAVYGSAARDAMGPSSDIDVLTEGNAEAVEKWRLEAENEVDREVNVTPTARLMTNPPFTAEVLDESVVLRDSRKRLTDLREELIANGQLDGWLLRMMREAVADFDEPAPGRPFSDTERRFMDALGKLRNERDHLAKARTPLDAQWITHRVVRAIRNLLRDWPTHGDYRNPRKVVDQLGDCFDPATTEALRRLPYETAEGNSTDPTIDENWTAAQEQVRPILEDLVEVATQALRSSLRCSDG